MILHLRTMSANMRTLRPRANSKKPVDTSFEDKYFNRIKKENITEIKEEADSKKPLDISFEDKYFKRIKKENITEIKEEIIISDGVDGSEANGERSQLELTKHNKETSATVGDIENGGWEPQNWKETWENIMTMRKLHVAPVDSLGCEKCPNKDASPEVYRYQVLISGLLSSQTKDEVTYAASQRLIEHGLTVDNILKTSDKEISDLIYPVGFWKTKVKHIRKTTQILKDQYNSDIPRTINELCKLPGIGPKIAHLVMSVGWNDTVGIAVDTHLHRISNRLGWVKKTTKIPEETRKALESWLPKEFWKDVSLLFVGFGQTVCKPVKPNCQDCLNIHLCPFGRSSENME